MDLAHEKNNARKEVLSGEPPYICIPIVGKTEQEIKQEVANIASLTPDLVEWRADFFSEIGEADKVFALLRCMRSQLGDIPILFTIRSVREGGNPISLNDQQQVQLLADLCKQELVDLIDYELDNDHDQIRYLRSISAEHQVKMIISYHNFQLTPPTAELEKLCRQADEFQPDFVKVAVMPADLADVLELLKVTHLLRNQLRAKLITMSMGKYGVISRLFGWVLGSEVTFGIDKNSSAPGQIPIKDLQTVIEITRKYVQ